MKHLIAALGVLLSPHLSVAFVDNVVHGYQSCTACHYSPSGGGLLTDYGRSLSKELMSTWSRQNSELPAFGLVKESSWFKIGGDYRAIQTYLENSSTKQGRQFEMQKNIELGIRANSLWFIGTLGTTEGPSHVVNKGQFLSERHYVLWNYSDELKVRVGKFRLNYGLNEPNHTFFSKQRLGFGSNSESYILEISHFTDNSELFLSSDLGRIDLPRNFQSEKSISLGYSYYTNPTSKLGANVLFGESENKRRTLTGIHGIFKPFERSIVKFQADLERYNLSQNSSSPKLLTTNILSFGYLVAKGFTPYIFHEYIQSDFEDSKSKSTALGIGSQWLPFPHFELQAEYRKLKSESAFSSTSDSGWILFHFYL